MSNFLSMVDAPRNLVRISFRGRVTPAGLAAGLPQFSEQIGGMARGFRLLADSSELEVMELECAPQISRIMDLCREHGVAKVVRVMPDPSKDIGINILSIIHYRGQVPLITVATLAEAEREISV